MRAKVLILAVLTLPSEAATSGDWPCWRGPERDGVSRETGWASRGREAWRREVGLGYSAPTVAGGRLFVSGHDVEAGEDTWYALDAATGEVLWTHSFEAELMANFHEGGTIATAAVEGDAVLVTHRQGFALCFDAATGEVRWRRNYAEELGVAVPMHGFSGSPVLVDGRLIVSLGPVALAASTADGAVQWRSEPRPGGAYSTPTPFESGGRALLADFATAGLAIRDRATGEELAFHPFTTEIGLNAASPVIAGDRIFISAAYDMGAELLSFTGDALEVDWGTKAMRNKVQTSVLWEGHLYGFDESMLKCIDLAGNERWRARGLGMGALTASDGRLLVTTSRGELLIAEATPAEFRELAREKLVEGGVCWTAPTLANGFVYVRSSRGELVARDHRPSAVAEAIAAPEAPPLPEVLPTAEALLERHAAAIGGRDAWRELAGLRIEGSFDAPASGVNRGSAVLSHRAPDAMRLEVDLEPFGTQSRGNTGGEDGFGWSYDAMRGPVLLEGDALRMVADEARIDSLVDPAAGFARLELVARETFDERLCWRVAATGADGVALDLWFDADTGFLAGRSAAGGAEIAYRDWAPYGAVWIPRHRRSLAADTGEEEVLRVESVSLAPIEAAAVAPPEPVQRLLLSDEEIAAEEARLRSLYSDLLGTYVSTFESEQDVPLVVHRGRLAFQFGADTYSELAEPAVGDDRWLLPAMEGMWVRFQRDDAGAVTGLVFHMLGEDQVWRRR